MEITWKKEGVTMEGIKMAKVKVELHLPVECKQWYQRQAKRRGLSMSAYMLQVLNDYIEKRLATNCPANAFDKLFDGSNDEG
jgi:hypothetical protein